jgi:hypothetical protein
MGFNVYMQGGRGAVLPDLDYPSLHFTVFVHSGESEQNSFCLYRSHYSNSLYKKSVIGELAYPMAEK